MTRHLIPSAWQHELLRENWALSSIEASEVLSSMRVAPRSLTSAASVSITMSSAVAARLSTGQVQVMSPTVRKRTSRL